MWLNLFARLPWGVILKFILTRFNHYEHVQKELPMKKTDKSYEWMWLAETQLGIHEKLGGKENFQILAYHEETTLKASKDEVAWCSAFVCWVMERSGIPSTRSAAARSWLKWGRPTIKREGAIAVLWRDTKTSWKGHVGFYAGECPKKRGNILILGGNQDDGVSIKSYPGRRVLEYRWPNAKP